MKRLITLLLVVAVTAVSTNVYSQGWLRNLGNRVVNTAKQKIEQKVEETTGEIVDDVLDGDNNQNSNTNEEVNNQAQSAATPAQSAPATEMTWNKFDFVSGDEIMFEDNQASEQLGEFPSQWDLLEGSAENVSIGGVMAFEMQNHATLIPLMKEKNYLPEKFTVEFDFFFRDTYVNHDDKYGGDWTNGTLFIDFYDANDNRVFRGQISPHTRDYHEHYDSYIKNMDYEWSVNGDSRYGTSMEVNLTTEAWHRISISFNKRAMKLYLDQTRLFNIPNMTAPASFRLSTYTDAEKLHFIKNVRIAKGAVPLYDRMMSEGKFITYGITFDVGKSTIKPESMGEINRIVQLMTENPDLKFSVEGHTDSTGSDTSNQTLSEARAQAIVDKLAELGISKDRLKAVGKGESSPIADNATDEGRAKNRRVEFVKI